MKPRISMIALGVNDVEKSIAFYKEGLGFPKMESPPEIAFFTLNGSWLSLYSREALLKTQPSHRREMDSMGLFWPIMWRQNLKWIKSLSKQFQLVPHW